MSETINFESQLARIKAAAARSGADTNLLYLTTLDRYTTQLNILSGLKKKLKAKSLTIAARGKLIDQYNKTAQAANSTTQTLIRIVQSKNLTSIMDLTGDTDEL